MGLFDDVCNTLGSDFASDSSQSSLANAALSMLSKQGGISALAEQFAAKGMGNLVSSWIGTGQNLPVSPEQLQSVLGSEQVKEVAANAGISPETAQQGLAQILPRLVDCLTPKGEVQDGDLMSRGMELLKGKLSA